MDRSTKVECYSDSVEDDLATVGQGEGKAVQQGESMQRPTRSVAPACVALYLAVVVGLLLIILHRDGGVFTYTLDDPYIHLALAQSIAHGHYGINLSEASSPSSSILWPFLLTPFSDRACNQYLPLLWNILFCGTAAWWLGRIVDGWQPRAGVAGEAVSATSRRIAWLGRFVLAAALMLLANLAGLTFIGMEHGLQVLLAILCAAGVLEAFSGRRIPAWSLCAAALGPMVRYENFALVAAVAVVLYGQQRWRTALKLLGISLIGPALFSCFLLSRGLPALPCSVMVKAHLSSAHGSTLLAKVLSLYGVCVHEPAWWGQLALLFLLVSLMRRERQHARRFVLGGALLAALLQLGVGRSYWFHRYEDYAMIFTALVAATALLSTATPRRTWRVILLLLVLAVPYESALWQTPAAASNVYQQQYQMHRFVADFYGKTVAVNDLGWVSYHRPAGVSVLDLWGLASPEAAQETHKNAGWLDEITTAHNAGLAIIYPEWYEEGAPDDWNLLGTMCITSRLTSIWHPCVNIYRTAVGDPVTMRAELAAFTRTLPASVNMTLIDDSDDDK